MPKPNKARWSNDVINGHLGSTLSFNYGKGNVYHVLAQVWPADSRRERWWVSIMGQEATATAASQRQAQAWARRDLKRLREKLEAL